MLSAKNRWKALVRCEGVFVGMVEVKKKFWITGEQEKKRPTGVKLYHVLDYEGLAQYNTDIVLHI